MGFGLDGVTSGRDGQLDVSCSHARLDDLGNAGVVEHELAEAEREVGELVAAGTFEVADVDLKSSRPRIPRIVVFPMCTRIESATVEGT